MVQPAARWRQSGPKERAFERRCVADVFITLRWQGRLDRLVAVEQSFVSNRRLRSLGDASQPESPLSERLDQLIERQRFSEVNADCSEKVLSEGALLEKRQSCSCTKRMSGSIAA